MTPALEMWAGLECTRNRVGETYFDQCQFSGHLERPQDLNLFRDLGVQRLRYPCLWETAEHSWAWLDERLGRLRQLDLDPIVTLVHHGSGPKHTSLIDADFPEKLARYASAFARRYPWITDFTPVNEPLTTARFSCLYGHWYPHLREDRAFARAIYIQVRAVALAMKAIREINPEARLVQTEDLGLVQSTPAMAIQRDFENERRWLTFDLLSGTLDDKRPLHQFLRDNEISVRELDWFLENPCPPDVLGINHYLLSNRFLDHQIGDYPPEFHGRSAWQTYADVGAVDTGRAEPPPLSRILTEAFERFGRPVAVTEAHLHGPREAQLRWLGEIWREAEQARAAGVDVCAVTAWSLLGTYDWNELCTRFSGFYESGVYDLRTPGEPRPTALARMIQSLAKDKKFDHPVLAQPGWWRQPKRIKFVREAASVASAEVRPAPAIRAVGGHANWVTDLESRADVRDLSTTRDEARPAWAMVDVTAPAPAELTRPEMLGECKRWARAAREQNLPLLFFSTDLALGGGGEPRTETAPREPKDEVGRRALEREEIYLSEVPGALCVRVGFAFGGEDDLFVKFALEHLRRGEKTCYPDAVSLSPLYVPDLIDVSLDLLIDGETGIVHLCHPHHVSPAELVRGLARRLKRDPALAPSGENAEVEKALDLKGRAPLSSGRMHPLPKFEESLDRFVGRLPREYFGETSI